MTFESQEVPSAKEGVRILRVDLKSEDDATRWLENYQKDEETNFIVLDNMSSDPKRYIFHKKWVCHLGEKNKVASSKRNLGCPFEIDILVKKLTRGTKKNDEYLRKERPLQGVITIRNTHNHPTKGNCNALGLLRMTPEVRNIFEGYFKNGYGAGEAIRMHESRLLLEEDGATLMANASVNPTPRSVYHIHEMWRNSEYGKAWSGRSATDVLKQKIDDYASEGTYVKVHEEEESRIIMIVTPIMRRAHELEESSEIVFTDSTSCCDSERSIITVMMTATKSGAVPLAVLIHNRDTQAEYTAAYRLLQQEFPRCFGGKTYPETFMTDNCVAEKAALRTVWPASVQFLCFFHVGQQEWRWLCEAKNGIKLERRQTLMQLFLDIMYANTEDKLSIALSKFSAIKEESYKQRVEAFLERKNEWVKLFRKDILYRGHDTNNFAEATIRILKDIVVCRTKAYNACALVDFIARVWEEYFQKRILHYAYGRDSGPKRVHAKLCKRLRKDLVPKMEVVGEDRFRVPSSKDNGTMYEVNSRFGWCSCPQGWSGAFCKHQLLVQEEFGKGFPNEPATNFRQRYQLGWLALGDKNHDPQFYVGLTEAVTEEDLSNARKGREAEGFQLPSLELQPPGPEESSQNDSQEPTRDEITESSDLLHQKIVAVLEDLHKKESVNPREIYVKTQRNLLNRLEKIRDKAPNQFLDCLLKMSVAAGLSRVLSTKKKKQYFELAFSSQCYYVSILSSSEAPS